MLNFTCEGNVAPPKPTIPDSFIFCKISFGSKAISFFNGYSISSKFASSLTSVRITSYNVCYTKLLRILLLQSADWLEDKIVNNNKGAEFFILLFSSLLGMYFMISAGDFLMSYNFV